MQSGSFWAFREAAELPDYEQDIPVVKMLWNKTHTARRPHLCTACHDEIAPGSIYRSQGWLIDGVFEASKLHGAHGGYPSPCPRWSEKDRQELADQFAADQARYFPTHPQGERI